MQEEMIVMAARTKKIPRAGAKALRERGAEEIDKSVKPSDATSQKPSLPKINADLINEDDLTKEEEMAAIMKLGEISLRKFLEDEPDIYTLEDLKVRYK
jgi:phage antirepressor YoqD-like protein